MQDPSLERFLDFTNRLVAATDFAGVKFGVLHTTEEQPRVLALRAELVSSPGSPEVERFSADWVSAFAAFGPTGELARLIAQLDRGQLETFVEPIFTRPIALPEDRWNYDNSDPAGRGQCELVFRFGLDVAREFRQRGVRELDGAIARASDYEISSLARLIARFTGQKYEHRRVMELELVAPWPVTRVSAQMDGSRLRVEIDGLAGSKRDRLILNLESDRGDHRLAERDIEWTEPHTDGKRTYVGLLPPLEHAPTAINVHYRGVDEVWLHESMQQGQTRHGETAQSISPSPPPEPPATAPEAATVKAAITKIHIESFRGLRDIELELTPLTVLVGPNQAGKSSILDALDVLSRAARSELYDALVRRRGGFSRLVWRGDGPGVMQFDVDLAVPGQNVIRYSATLGPVGRADYAVERERIYQRQDDRWNLRLALERGKGQQDGQHYQSRDPHELFIAQAGPELPEAEIARSALASIAVYPYLATGASWAELESAGMRTPTRPEPGARLHPNGSNLAAALHSLREGQPGTWELFIDIVKLAFPSLADIKLPSAARGYIELAWYDERFDDYFDASELSDGTLAYLANLCALLSPGGSLVAIDELERSLHPDALYRLVGAARLASDTRPVLLTTQSDRLIGFLDDIPDSVVIARAGQRGTELIRPGKEDRDDLARWLREFSLADLRRELEGWGLE